MFGGKDAESRTLLWRSRSPRAQFQDQKGAKFRSLDTSNFGDQERQVLLLLWIAIGAQIRCFTQDQSGSARVPLIRWPAVEAQERQRAIDMETAPNRQPATYGLAAPK